MPKSTKCLDRIAIYGSSGSGKSYLARKLGEILNHNVIHIDDIFWQPDWVVPDFEDFKQNVIDATNVNHWVLDGNYSKIRKELLSRVTLAVILDFPLYLCLVRIFLRTFGRAYRIKLKEITPLPKNVTRTKSNNNLKDILVLWAQAIKFKKKTRYEISSELRAHKGINTIVLRNKQDLSIFIISLKKMIEK